MDFGSCSLCTRAWTNSGKHRIVALTCGHMFGACCIDRHLRQRSVCPVAGCGVRCTAAAARPVFGVLSVVDPAQQIEHDRLVAETRRLQDATAAVDLERVAVEAEVDRIRAAMQIERARPRRRAPQAPAAKRPRRVAAPASGKLHRLAAVAAVQATALAWAPGADVFLIAQKLRTVGRREHGLRSICAIDPARGGACVTLHDSPIRSVAWDAGRSSSGGGMALTVAADQRLRLTSVSSMSAVMEYDLGEGGYSCAWGPSAGEGGAGPPGTFIAAGLRNGTVAVYDVRQTRGALRLLSTGGSEPVHSLCFLRSGSKDGCAAGAAKEEGALLVAGTAAGVVACAWAPIAGTGDGDTAAEGAAPAAVAMRPLCARRLLRNRPCSYVVSSPRGAAECIVALRSPALPAAPRSSAGAAAGGRRSAPLAAALLAVHVRDDDIVEEWWSPRITSRFRGHAGCRIIARPCAWSLPGGGMGLAIGDERDRTVCVWTSQAQEQREPREAAGATAAAAAVRGDSALASSATVRTAAHALPVRDVRHAMRPGDGGGGSLAALTRDALVLWGGLEDL